MPRTKLKVEIDADSAKFNRRMKALSATVAGVGIAIAAVGVAASVAFVRMASNVAKTNDELGKTAKKLQLTVEQLQQLQLLAQFSGVGLKGVEGAFRGIGTKVLDLKRGLAAAKEEFALLGLDESSFGANTFDNFLTVLKALEKIPDKQMKLALANKILGRSGADFVAALSEGEGSIDKIMKRVSSNKNFLISQKEVDVAESMNDQITEFGFGMKKLKSVISSETFPAYEKLVKSATEFIDKMLTNKEFPDLLKSVGEAADELAILLKKAFQDVELDDIILALTEVAKLIKEISALMNESGLNDLVGGLLGANAKSIGSGLQATRESVQGGGILSNEFIRNIGFALDKIPEDVREIKLSLKGIVGE